MQGFSFKMAMLLATSTDINKITREWQDGLHLEATLDNGECVQIAILREDEAILTQTFETTDRYSSTEECMKFMRDHGIPTLEWLPMSWCERINPLA